MIKDTMSISSNPFLELITGDMVLWFLGLLVAVIAGYVLYWAIKSEFQNILEPTPFNPLSVPSK